MADTVNVTTLSSKGKRRAEQAYRAELFFHPDIGSLRHRSLKVYYGSERVALVTQESHIVVPQSST